MFDAVQLAWFILRRCANNGTPISNLQLQKMLYFLQRTNLQRENEALFFQNIRAWQFGPVVREVYYTFSVFSSLKIIPEDSDPNPVDIILEPFLLEEIDRRSTQRPWDLVDETHQKGGAWDIIFKDGLGNDKIIPLELIRNDG